MGSPWTKVNVPQILKEIWHDSVEGFVYGDSAFHGLIPKDNSWSGLYTNVVIDYGGVQASSNFNSAKLNRNPSSYGKMQVETHDEFVIWDVDHKLIALSRNDKGALIKALEESTTKAFHRIKRRTMCKLWRPGGGAIAKAASISTTSVTLSDPNDVRHFEVNDVIAFAPDDGYTATAGVYAETRTVSAIDETDGVITFTADVSTVPGIGATPYLFQDGDYNNSFYGVPRYIPQYDPGSSSIPTSVWGMTQTAHMTRLAGHRFTSSNLSAVEAIQTLMTKASRRNVKFSHLFVTPEVFQEIDQYLGSNRRYTDEKQGSVGFSGLKFNHAGKSCTVYEDADIPSGRGGSTERLCYGLKLNSWKLHSAGTFPGWLTLDGKQQFMLEENANASQGRIGGYLQAYTDAPGDNAVLVL